MCVVLTPQCVHTANQWPIAYWDNNNINVRACVRALVGAVLVCVWTFCTRFNGWMRLCVKNFASPRYKELSLDADEEKSSSCCNK